MSDDTTTSTTPSTTAAAAAAAAAGTATGEGKLINATSGNEGKLFVGGLAKLTTVESLKAYFEA